ncbi:MAG: hypothetical protein A3F41_04260 [Coxiella sp. RIFCSPHIGHO2_12_FULL_44_14]|nr:MAG: hypothetical protein A3F41_04260 [Coxiella sp. RIFCSPHIGHO2_12_FULL_44_14]
MPTSSIHANLMVIDDVGTLICGSPHSGKSELTLMLLDRGHRLVADDAVELQNKNGVLIGHCPAAIYGFMQIDFVGVINIEKIYGQQALLTQHTIEIVIHLTQNKKNMVLKQPLTPLKSHREFLRVILPQFELPNTPEKSVALLTETLVHNYKLKKFGYDVYQDFLSRTAECNKND